MFNGARDGLSEAARANLPKIVNLRLSQSAQVGWSPRLRAAFGHYTPDEWYESFLDVLVADGAEWLDVGCGWNICPSNRPLSVHLRDRTKLLVGLDPSDNIDRNEYVHQRVKARLEDYKTDQRFDLITLRMVAEHLDDPDSAVHALANLLKPLGRVMIYTVHKYTPAAILADLTPTKVHHVVKRVLWSTEPEDTFPTAYKMNTRRDLRRILLRHGLREELYQTLDDTRSLARWWITQALELSAWRMLSTLRVPYPERCILGIYTRG